MRFTPTRPARRADSVIDSLYESQVVPEDTWQLGSCISHEGSCGPYGTRTRNLLLARQALYQLSLTAQAGQWESHPHVPFVRIEQIAAELYP